LHIGYRKGQGAGKWVVRYYTGQQTYQVETIATADDLSDANGVDVLSFKQHRKRHGPPRRTVKSWGGNHRTIHGQTTR
jgi:hypothetical protein